MSLKTENDIRTMISEGLLQEKGQFHLGKDTILTPSARAYLLEKNITIIAKEGGDHKESVATVNEPNEYVTNFGLHLNHKPEHMTHLRGNLLVFKDHKRIILRGAIDRLESEIILVQLDAQKDNKPKLVEDLEEIIFFIRRLLQCEVTGEPVGEIKLQGLQEQEIRDQSYHPSQYFGIKHFLPNMKHGEVTALLNRLRTLTRQTEIIAFKAFKAEDNTITREDIIQAFNRLSSLFWIMMFKYLSGRYDEKEKT